MLTKTARATFALACASILISCARAPKVPRPQNADAPRSDFIKRGEYVFRDKSLAGQGGQTCANCHENHVPFEDYSLSRQFYDLPKLVENCMYHDDRTKHVRGPGSGLDSRALREYIVYNYILRGVIADEDPEGIRKLGEAMENFLGGEYDTALGEIRGARQLVKTEKNKVQSFALEGCIQLFKLNDREARRAFQSALKLDPQVRINGYVFSPKVLRVLEDTRATFVNIAEGQ